MTTPGIHPLVRLDRYTNDEQKIIKKLSREWYITSGGGLLNLGSSSQYKYFLMRPIQVYNEMFNIERDLVVIFSDYEEFQARTLDSFDKVSHEYAKLRIEKICGVLISKDKKIDLKLRELLKNEQETLVVVPFSYAELLTDYSEYFIRNRFKKHFYTRDLFAFESPLKKDIFFFGRNDLIHDIVNRHASNENSGLFGLRKTGKTSVIFGIIRNLEKTNNKSIFIDCQNPSLHRRRWFEALEYLIDETISQFGFQNQFKKTGEYNDLNAAKFFEIDLINIYKLGEKSSILFIFDEIENITFKISPSSHWCDDFDFIFFWQSLRSAFQKNTGVFTYLIVGTNPICVETPSVNGKDNPIFSQIPFQYIPRFDIPQTREMLLKLGLMMGIYFDEVVYSLITEDFGGHPFLMRHLCSIINRIAPTERPLKVDKGLYEHCKKIFINEHSKYFDMILNVLQNHFNDEFEMLRYLARGEYSTFKELAILSPELTNHLIGYGIIECKNDIYSFRNDSIKNYLLIKEKYKKITQTKDEMIREISERRNQIEPQLRRILKNQLIAFYGKSKAKENFSKYIPEKRRTQANPLSYEDLFDANKFEIYFEDLRIVIGKNWEIFKHIFGNDKEEFELIMSVINKYRVDAHSKDISTENMQHFRSCIAKLESFVKDFM